MGNEQIIRVQKRPEAAQVILLFIFTAELVAAVRRLTQKHRQFVVDN